MFAILHGNNTSKDTLVPDKNVKAYKKVSQLH